MDDDEDDAKPAVAAAAAPELAAPPRESSSERDARADVTDDGTENINAAIKNPNTEEPERKDKEKKEKKRELRCALAWEREGVGKPFALLCFGHTRAAFDACSFSPRGNHHQYIYK